MGKFEPIILELCFQWVAYYIRIILQRAPSEPFILDLCSMLYVMPPKCTHNNNIMILKKMPEWANYSLRHPIRGALLRILTHSNSNLCNNSRQSQLTIGAKMRWHHSWIAPGKWHVKNRKKDIFEYEVAFNNFWPCTCLLVVSCFWIACTMKTA